MALNYKSFKQKIIKLKVPVILVYLSLFTYAYLNEMKIIKLNKLLLTCYFTFSILAWYIVSVRLSENIKIYKGFNFISKYSFAAYLSHIFVVGFVVNNIRDIFKLKDWLAIGVIIWILSSILAPVLIKFISLFPYTKCLTGIKNKKKEFKDNMIETIFSSK